MLRLNKFCLPINVALVICNLWLHQPGWAALAAVCIWCNLSAIKSIEDRK